jgi:hypothetical protein
VKGFGLDAVYAVTLVIYALVLIGWMGFAILLNNPFLAWVLGIFLLAPPPLFAGLVQAAQPYPGQVFFLGLMAAALTRWPASRVPPALVALAGGSIWASDFSIIILGVVAAAWFLASRQLIGCVIKVTWNRQHIVHLNVRDNRQRCEDYVLVTRSYRLSDENRSFEQRK